MRNKGDVAEREQRSSDKKCRSSDQTSMGWKSSKVKLGTGEIQNTFLPPKSTAVALLCYPRSKNQ